MTETTLLWAARACTALLVLATLAPLVPTGWWFIRGWDFPRVQVASLAVAVFLILAGLAMHQWRAEHAITLTLLLAVVAWQSAHVLPYTRAWPTEVPNAPAGATPLRVAIVNLKVENDRHDDVRAMIADLDPDVLLLVEADETWIDALAPLAETFAHREGVERGEGLGLHVWSKPALRDTSVEHLVSDRRASIFTTLTLDTGHAVRLVCVHPTPPGLSDATPGGRRDSRVRDAELVLVAQRVADDTDAHWIVAGDFNDVAWSHTTRLFKRLSGLIDPRVGRRLLNSYHADYPLLRYPLDHVFVSHGFSLAGLSRHRPPGSDHFALVADLVLNDPDGAQPEPQGDDHEEAEAIVEAGQQDATQRGVQASPD